MTWSTPTGTARRGFLSRHDEPLTVVPQVRGEVPEDLAGKEIIGVELPLYGVVVVRRKA